MSRNDRYQQQYNEILDVITRNALISNADSYFGDIPTEEEIRQAHSFSPEFIQNMEILLHMDRLSAQRQRPWLSAGAEAQRDFARPDQSFWEEWKLQAAGRSADSAAAKAVIPAACWAHPETRACRRQKLRWPVKAAATVAAIGIAIGGLHLSDNGFLRASRTQNVVEYGKQGTMITSMPIDDYDLVFKKPAFIPKGYRVVSDFINDYNYMRILKYSDGIKTLTIKYTLCKENFDAGIDSERHPQERKSIRLSKKYDAMLFAPEPSDSYIVLLWQDGLVEYQILGYEPEENLVQIAESISP